MARENEKPTNQNSGGQDQTPNPVKSVAARVDELVQSGRINLPEDYSVHNALMEAWLVLQQTYDKNDKPVLEVCTRASIMQSLFDMVVQGLNPRKQQGYFLPYGSQLVFQKSYFGHKTLAKRVSPKVYDIVAEVIWENDEFEYQIDRGQKVVTKHVQRLENVDSKSPKGAYAQAIDRHGNVISTIIMTWEQIKQAWKQSPIKPFDQNDNLKPNSTHSKFMEDMIKKTPVGKLARHIVNSSTDDHLFRQVVQREDQVSDEFQAESEIEGQENLQMLDVTEPGEHPADAKGLEGSPEPAPGQVVDAEYRPEGDAAERRTGPSGEAPPDEAIDVPGDADTEPPDPGF